MELAQTYSTPGSSSSGALIWVLVIFIVWAVAGWMVFVKAGQAGWKSLIPIYSTYVLLKIVGRPSWWLLLFLIPFVNFVIWIVVALDLAKSFGKGTGFGLGLIFLSIIFYAILGFGSARYVGPAGSPAMPPPAPPMPA